MSTKDGAALAGLNEERRRLALNYLRHRIKEAHIRGDGSTVNHLCAVALEHLRKWQSEENCPLSIGDYWWAVAMAC